MHRWQWGEELLRLSLLMPSLSIAVGVSSLLTMNGGLFLYGLPGILLCHIVLNIPLATSMILKGYQVVPSGVWVQAVNLRLKGTVLFWNIELPLLSGVLLQTAGLVFVFCFSSFTIPLMMGGGPDKTTLTVSLYYSLVIQGDIPFSLILLGTKLSICGIIVGGLKRPSDNTHEVTPTTYCDPFGTSLRPHTLLRPGRISGLFTIILLFFLCLPVGNVVWGPMKDWVWSALQGKAYLHWPNGLRHALQNSISLAVSSATIALLLSIGIRCLTFRWRSYLEQAAHMILILPGFVGGIIIFLLVQKWFDILPQAFYILLLLNSLTGIPLALKVISPSWQYIEKHYRYVQTCLRLPLWARLRWVYGPLLSPNLRLAFVVVAAYSLGDLSGILLFDQQEFLTLPNLIYTAYGHFDGITARLLSLVLVVIVSVLFFISRFMSWKIRNAPFT